MLKGIARFFGTSFLSLGLTLLLVGYFALGLYAGLDDFKAGLPELVRDSLREYGADKIIAENADLQQVAQLCQTNPGLAECGQLAAFKRDPAVLLEQPQIQEQFQQLQQQIDVVIEQAERYREQAQLGFYAGIGLLILGGALVWLGSPGFFAAGKTLGWSLGFSGLFSFLLYQYGVSVGLDVAGKQLVEGLTGSLSGVYAVLADNAYQYVLGFVEVGLTRVAYLALGIAIAAFLLALVCWWMQKQRFKKAVTRK